MSKSVTKYLSLATLGLLAVSVSPQLASAATTQSYGTQGEVTFTAGTDTTGPVDPQDPTVDPRLKQTLTDTRRMGVPAEPTHSEDLP